MKENKKSNTIDFFIKFPWEKIIIWAIIFVIFITSLQFFGEDKPGLSPGTEGSYEYSITPWAPLTIIGLLIVLFIVRKGRKTIEKEAITKSSKKKAIPEYQDVKQALKSADKLIEKLPSEEIKKFINSKEAENYNKVMQWYGINK
ncbi:MAG: hypothetical protein Q8P57_04490 [Candidatus Pacearchaeota archaeon]|nr:hypothetical protein [Candidatus Pacearchaeota archaeon]